LKRPFRPPKVTLKEIHDAVPKHLLRPNPVRATLYVVRDITISSFLFKVASSIAYWESIDYYGLITSPPIKVAFRAGLWVSYWCLQGLLFAGMFCLGHDAGHGSLYNQKFLNNLVGFLLHTFLLIPYFSWRATHHAHHKATASMERDENYVPYTRSSYKLPDKKTATKIDYSEAFEETPLATRLVGLPEYELDGWRFSSTGDEPFQSKIDAIKPHLCKSIIISDVSLMAMLGILYHAGWDFVSKYYLIPYFVSPVMFTFLHHSDPTIPHYRKNAWTFLKGAAATVDRPLLGWAGRFFFHNISHDHVAHHFFLSAPFFNGPQITRILKSVLDENYNYDSTPSFYALWRSFTQCLFVEEEGDIIFYKDKNGNAARQVADAFVGGT
ncbi:Delta(12) fatty acid desaturase, partial [Leucoagaricus sp. SymC.cos]